MMGDYGRVFNGALKFVFMLGVVMATVAFVVGWVLWRFVLSRVSILWN